MKKILIVLLLVVVVAVGAWLFTWWRSPKIGHVKDEAQLAGLTADYFNAADEKEYLRDMDRGHKGPIDLSPDEIKGRNTWVMWTAGNDRLWDKLTLAQLACLTADYFNAADEKEYLRDMDRGPKGPIDLSPDEIKGRNTWVMWTAGNDRRK